MSKYKEAKKRIDEYIEMLCIHALSSGVQPIDIELTYQMIEAYLKKRGYSVNTLRGYKIYTKAFTCAIIHKDTIEVWHDVKDSKHQFIKSSLLTGLPITLNYMEKI
jgi:hypothetical protein